MFCAEAQDPHPIPRGRMQPNADIAGTCIAAGLFMSPRPRLLLIDDDMLLRLAFVRRFKRQYDVLSAASGEEALEFLAAGARFDIIICDLHLTGISGLEFCAELAQLAPDQVERVIFQSGYPCDALVAATTAKYLEKPASIDDINAAIYDVIGAFGRAAA